MAQLLLSSGTSSTPAKASSFSSNTIQGTPWLKARMILWLNLGGMTFPSTWRNPQPVWATQLCTSVFWVTQCLRLQGSRAQTTHGRGGFGDLRSLPVLFLKVCCHMTTYANEAKRAAGTQVFWYNPTNPCLINFISEAICSSRRNYIIISSILEWRRRQCSYYILTTSSGPCLEVDCFNGLTLLVFIFLVSL